MHPSKHKSLDEAVRKLVTAFQAPEDQITGEVVEDFPEDGTIFYYFSCESGPGPQVQVDYKYVGKRSYLKAIHFFI